MSPLDQNTSGQASDGPRPVAAPSPTAGGGTAPSHPWPRLPLASGREDVLFNGSTPLPRFRIGRARWSAQALHAWRVDIEGGSDTMSTTVERPGRQSEASEISLESVIITSALARRPTRRPDHASEAAALHDIGRALGGKSRDVLELLMNQAIWLCDAGSAGVSLLETDPVDPNAQIFRWTALAGALASHVGGTTPRAFSPCGVCLDQDRPVLFSHPERYFTYFASAGIPFVEGLVIPFHVRERQAGTVWILSHRESRRFDLEDVRIMTQLAAFTGAAYALMQRRDD